MIHPCIIDQIPLFSKYKNNLPSVVKDAYFTFIMNFCDIQSIYDYKKRNIALMTCKDEIENRLWKAWKNYSITKCELNKKPNDEKCLNNFENAQNTLIEVRLLSFYIRCQI
jgi:hypothetical protein